MTMTSDQIAQAKAQDAATKVAAVQALVTALNTPAAAAIAAEAQAALATLDTSDSIYSDVTAIANILTRTPSNLTFKLTPLIAMATPPAATVAATPAPATSGGSASTASATS